MKILAVITAAETAHACLDAALTAAAADRSARIEALHILVDPERLVSSSEEVQLQRLREHDEGSVRQRAAAAQAAFVSWNAGLDVHAPRVDWKEVVGAEEESLAEAARDADIIVLAKHVDLDSADARHAALLKCGKPVLMVPGDWRPQGNRFDHVAIGLSDTPIATHAIDKALPWIQAASEVTALRIGCEEDAAVAQVDRLREMGPKITLRLFPPAGNDLGAQIVMVAASIGADLLVVGAYRHGPLVEWLLGGTTRHMLAASAVPLFLVH